MGYLCKFRDKLAVFSQPHTSALFVLEAGMSDCLLFIQRCYKCPVAIALILRYTQTGI